MDPIYKKILNLIPVLNQVKENDLIRYRQGSIEFLSEIKSSEYGYDLFIQTDDGHIIMFRDVSYFENNNYTDGAYQDLSYYCIEPLELWSKIDDCTYKCIWKEGK